MIEWQLLFHIVCYFHKLELPKLVQWLCLREWLPRFGSSEKDRELEYSQHESVIVPHPSSRTRRILYCFPAATRYWKQAFFANCVSCFWTHLAGFSRTALSIRRRRSHQQFGAFSASICTEEISDSWRSSKGNACQRDILGRMLVDSEHGHSEVQNPYWGIDRRTPTLPAVLWSGKFCANHGHSYEWVSDWPKMEEYHPQDNFVVLVVPGLTASFESISFQHRHKIRWEERQQQHPGHWCDLVQVLQKHTELQNELYDEWKREHQLYCCSPNWVMSGGRILWNAIAICETSEISWQRGKLRMNEDLENLSKDQLFQDKARIHQFWKKVLPGISLGYVLIAGVNLERRSSDCCCGSWTIRKVGRIRNLSHKTECKRSLDILTKTEKVQQHHQGDNEFQEHTLRESNRAKISVERTSWRTGWSSIDRRRSLCRFLIDPRWLHQSSSSQWTSSSPRIHKATVRNLLQSKNHERTCFHDTLQFGAQVHPDVTSSCKSLRGHGSTKRQKESPL